MDQGFTDRYVVEWDDNAYDTYTASYAPGWVVRDLTEQETVFYSTSNAEAHQEAERFNKGL